MGADWRVITANNVFSYKPFCNERNRKNTTGKPLLSEFDCTDPKLKEKMTSISVFSNLRTYRHPPKSFESNADCIFLGMEMQQKRQWLSKVVGTILKRQTEEDIQGVEGLISLVILNTADDVEWMTANIQDLKIEYGLLGNFENYPAPDGITMMSNFHIQGVLSKIMIGQPKDVTGILLKEPALFQQLKCVIMDIDPNLKWINPHRHSDANSCFTNTTRENNFESMLQLIYVTIKRNYPKFALCAAKLSSSQLATVIENLKDDWQLFVAFTKCIPNPNETKFQSLVRHMNTCDAMDKAIIICQKTNDTYDLASVTYSIGEGGCLYPPMIINRAVKDFENGSKRVLFLTPDQFNFIDVMKGTRYFDYDTSVYDDLYFCLLYEGRYKILQILNGGR